MSVTYVEQPTLFEPEAHVHQYEVMQGPYRICPPINMSSDKWCWSCDSWVRPLNNGGNYTYTDKFDMKKDLFIQIKKGQITKTNAIKEYAKSFDLSQYEAAREIDWAIGYYNENGI